MDPITLFALANAAVSAVKKGCQLYKDIKGAAGDVKAVLKDLDEQFANNHKDKPATVTQRNAYVEEKNRVIELNKKGGETAGIYQELANYLGDFFDNMNKCLAVIEEEERKRSLNYFTSHTCFVAGLLLLSFDSNVLHKFLSTNEIKFMKANNKKKKHYNFINLSKYSILFFLFY